MVHKTIKPYQPGTYLLTAQSEINSSMVFHAEVEKDAPQEHLDLLWDLLIRTLEGAEIDYLKGDSLNETTDYNE